MKPKQGQWHLLTGTVLGILLGVVFSLWILPVQYIDTEPNTLRTSDRERYREVVANAFLVEADTNRALARIALLQDANSSSALISQAQGVLASNGNAQTARGLALLGAAVNQPSLRITPLPATIGMASTPTLQTPNGSQEVNHCNANTDACSHTNPVCHIYSTTHCLAFPNIRCCICAGETGRHLRPAAKSAVDRDRS